jgi:hypothetical protein
VTVFIDSGSIDTETVHISQSAKIPVTISSSSTATSNGEADIQLPDGMKGDGTRNSLLKSYVPLNLPYKNSTRSEYRQFLNALTLTLSRGTGRGDKRRFSGSVTRCYLLCFLRHSSKMLAGRLAPPPLPIAH